MQRTNRMVLGLVAVFVLGGSLALLGCSSDDGNTTNVSDQVTAAAVLGGKSFTFTDGATFGVTAGNATTLSFNATATRFSLAATLGGTARLANGTVTYGSCILTVGSTTTPSSTVSGSSFAAGTGPQPNAVVTLTTCQFNGDTGTLSVTTTAGSATSGGGNPTGTGGFGG